AEGNSAPNPTAQVPDPQIVTPEEVREPTEGLPDPEKSNCHTQPVKEEKPVEVAEEDKISTPSLSQEKVSGLSIKSIRLKREMLARQQGNVDKAAEVLSEKFTETQLHAAWDEYIHRLKNKGEKILASIMETDMPTVSENTIS